MARTDAIKEAIAALPGVDYAPEMKTRIRRG
jgi:hypothetical protein